MQRLFRGISLTCAFFFCVTGASAYEIESVQLVGSFNGITCEPDDPANNMDSLGVHLWRKLKFINEPGNPDTIFFKFTMNGSYLPKHWGWSYVWGVAALGLSPPNIAAVLPDSGYHYFHFRDDDETYWIERPDGDISGVVRSDVLGGVPDGCRVTLFDDGSNVIGTFKNFSDTTFVFNGLPARTYSVLAGAPGYKDTLAENVQLAAGGSEWLALTLTIETAVFISSAAAEHHDGGILVRWSVKCCDSNPKFDIYRGAEPYLGTMTRRNSMPVTRSRGFRFLDRCEDPSRDYYYYIVEVGTDDPACHGPLFIMGITPGIRSSLGTNFPNPFNPATTIPYSVGPEGSNKPITIAFYDVAGRLIDRTGLGSKPTGSYKYVWNPALSRKRAIPSGVYYCRLQIGKEVFTSKLILLR